MDSPRAPADDEQAQVTTANVELVPRDGERPPEAARCLVCGACTGCGRISACVPCTCSGIDGLQSALCDRGGTGHSGRRYPWIARSAYGELLLQQYCERHLLLGKKRAGAHGIAHWARTPCAEPDSWTVSG